MSTHPPAKAPSPTIEPAAVRHIPQWAVLRAALWPDASVDEHASELTAILAGDHRFVAFVALDATQRMIGFVEIALRYDYVNGCETSPVAFLEGLYVVPEQRRQGIARMLCDAAMNWARAAGCTEMASDADLNNTRSHDFHASVGFEERERVVFFRKLL
ncbi:GNAT family N-acetyltransferase [Cupriavidus respiraculi]|uniref:aminoglycoside 6'-N-acetyltransferase n=1 Tax=Cupriavidus respiraculi TaxID=195930 RepID=UPI001C948BDA|nr:aminoglycoside 6'-N-acetyltransferase [Cupriavidus respiraculi]MBY4947243.1 GNAT family N-acetyltransferase [Cupriavidus respiraculi]